jgi:hypothetical protein
MAVGVGMSESNIAARLGGSGGVARALPDWRAGTPHAATNFTGPGCVMAV